MDTIIDFDRDLLIWLNSFHADWLDSVMLVVTKTEFWTPLYLFFIYLMFKKFDNRAWLSLVGVALTILIADQVTSSILKPLVHRLRPSQEPALQSVLHLVTQPNGEVYKGGLYGFASSHAANSFGIAMFLWLIFRKIYPWVFGIFICAVIMTYTRIYLGVHYPGDIIVGAFIGMTGAWLSYRLVLKLNSIADKKKIENAQQTGS